MQRATLSKVITEVDNLRKQGNLSSAIRLFVFDQVRTHGDLWRCILAPDGLKKKPRKLMRCRCNQVLKSAHPPPLSLIPRAIDGPF